MATPTRPVLAPLGKKLYKMSDEETILEEIRRTRNMERERDQQYLYRNPETGPTKMSDEEIMLEEFRIQLDDFFNKMTNMLISKKKDYGTSYDDIRQRFGEIVPLIRLNDKLMRYENLIKKDREPENEPLIDVFLDIIGYCVLEIFYRQVK